MRFSVCLLYILLREPPLDINPNSFHKATNKTRTRSRRKLIKYFVQTSSGSCSSKCFSKGDSSSSSKKKTPISWRFQFALCFFPGVLRGSFPSRSSRLPSPHLFVLLFSKGFSITFFLCRRATWCVPYVIWISLHCCCAPFRRSFDNRK